jgi:hypothetical protein
MWKGNLLANSEVENVMMTLILQGDDNVDDVQWKNIYIPYCWFITVDVVHLIIKEHVKRF